MRLAFALALLATVPGSAEPPAASKHIQKIMAKGDGLTEATAFKASSVRDEYEIAAALGVKVHSQALVLMKKPYDLLEGEDATGQKRELWFDISGFYPEF